MLTQTMPKTMSWWCSFYRLCVFQSPPLSWVQYVRQLVLLYETHLHTYAYLCTPLLAGLVSFLLGHVAFILAFYQDGGSSARPMQGAGLYAYAAGMVYVVLTFGKTTALCVCAALKRSLIFELQATFGRETGC